MFEQFAALVKSFSVNDEQYKWMVQALKETNSLREKEIEDRSKSIAQEIQKLNKRLSQLYEDKLDGLIDEYFYKLKSRQWIEQQKDLEISLSKLRIATEQQLELGLKILDFSKNAYSVFQEMEKFECGNFLRILLSNCTKKDDLLDWELKKPFDVLCKLRGVK